MVLRRLLISVCYRSACRYKEQCGNAIADDVFFGESGLPVGGCELFQSCLQPSQDFGAAGSDPPGLQGRISPAIGVRDERETEFGARVTQCVEVPDLGLNGGEVGHVDFEFWMLDVGLQGRRGAEGRRADKWKSRRIGG